MDEKRPPRALVAEVIAACCSDYRYQYTQFKAVLDLYMAGIDGTSASGSIPATSVDVRDMDQYKKAFEERCAS